MLYCRPCLQRPCARLCATLYATSRVDGGPQYLLLLFWGSRPEKFGNPCYTPRHGFFLNSKVNLQRLATYAPTILVNDRRFQFNFIVPHSREFVVSTFSMLLPQKEMTFHVHMSKKILQNIISIHIQKKLH